MDAKRVPKTGTKIIMYEEDDSVTLPPFELKETEKVDVIDRWNNSPIKK